MKKLFSAAAASALVFAAGYGIAGSKYMPPVEQASGCPGDCQDQIDGLQSSQARQDEQIDGLQSSQGRQDGQIDALQADQARQDEQINANAARLQQHADEINALREGSRKGERNPWYVRGTGRMLWAGSMDLDKVDYGFKAETDIGYGVGLSGGRQFGNFRVEGELATQKSDITVTGLSEVTIDTLMLNGFYHIPVPAFSLFGNRGYDGLSVYGTAGIGTGKVEVFFDNDIDESQTTFAYKVGMGVAFDVAANIAVDLGYEYLRTDNIELGHDHELLRVNDLKNSSINASVRYSF